MKTILILGAGTAGTAMAHKLRRRLSDDWEVVVVDPSTRHVYQPGLLFLPFGDETEERIVRERAATLGKGITWHQTEVKGIDTERRTVDTGDGNTLSYDFLIIASGTEIDVVIDLNIAVVGDNGIVEAITVKVRKPRKSIFNRPNCSMLFIEN